MDPGVAAVVVVGASPFLLALFPFLAILLVALADFIDRVRSSPNQTLGGALNELRDVLLSDPLLRPAGITPRSATR